MSVNVALSQQLSCASGMLGKLCKNVVVWTEQRILWLPEEAWLLFNV